MTRFARTYSSTGFRLWRHTREARRPFFKVYNKLPGFTYVGLGPLCLWRDGRRWGGGWR